MQTSDQKSLLDHNLLAISTDFFFFCINSSCWVAKSVLEHVTIIFLYLDPRSDKHSSLKMMGLISEVEAVLELK